MRWLTVAAVLLYLTRCNDAGVLKCHPGSEDPLCALEKKEILLPEQIIERDSSSEESEERQCLPGSQWDSNCHTCLCTELGFAECTPGISCLDEILADPILCKPNTTFKRYGDTCVCLENGQALCTLQHDVEKRSLHKREIPVTHKSKRSVCKPHSEFNVDCNPCKCAANGQSYTCTHNECLEGGEANKDVEVFMENEGADHVEQHKVCKSSSTFYVGCNTCHCNYLGNDYSCTNKPCPLPADVELFHELKEPLQASKSEEKVTTPNESTSNTTTKDTRNTRVICVANRMFVKDCNTCWCNENGTDYFCTRRVCVEESNGEDSEEIREIKKECKPNQIFEMDCNTCRCNADGKSYSCTRRTCLTSEKNVTSRSVRAVTNSEQKNCQPGQEFRLDCNKCLCDNEGVDFSCTRIDCAAASNGGPERSKRDITTIEQKCVAGSVFERECNVCRCTSDGQHAACTLRRCTKDTETTTESSPAFRCNPGEQYQQDCNDCTCSADGKNVFCTLRLCDQATL